MTMTTTTMMTKPATALSAASATSRPHHSCHRVLQSEIFEQICNRRYLNKYAIWDIWTNMLYKIFDQICNQRYLNKYAIRDISTAIGDIWTNMHFDKYKIWDIGTKIRDIEHMCHTRYLNNAIASVILEQNGIIEEKIQFYNYAIWDIWTNKIEYWILRRIFEIWKCLSKNVSRAFSISLVTSVQ